MNLRAPIVIIGFMACGKTEVARVVAEQLDVSMVDLDEVITSVEGRSPAELIRAEGERSFRQIETANLRRALESNNGSVIALGGGAWIESKNREMLAAKGAKTVWLDAPFELCWKRIESSSEDRPLGTTREQANELFQRRYPIYELASVRIDVKPAEGPAEIAERVLSELHQE
jgi:shikimate kinase